MAAKEIIRNEMAGARESGGGKREVEKRSGTRRNRGSCVRACGIDALYNISKCRFRPMSNR